MPLKKSLEPKPLFLERMKKLLADEKDYKKYLEILKNPSKKSIRCNTLKISSDELKKSLEKKWKISQPWKNHPEVMIVESDLEPGELGRSLEHQLGYYYIQELASMLPVLVLESKPNENLLDLCSAPGSKTTQISAKMQNKGTLIANDPNLGRIKILASNLERCGSSNVIITRDEGVFISKKFKKEKIYFDKILVDAPCSGEGTMRSKPKTRLIWNANKFRRFSKLQKKLVENSFEILKPHGILVYSTCTHAPEENEEVVDYILKKFKDKIKIEKISVPVKSREGITNWNEKEFSSEVKKCARIYPQDNNTDGFFIAKFRRIE